MLPKPHAQPIWELIKQKSSRKAWKKLNNICPLNILAYVSMCDTDGRGFPPEGKEGEFKTIMEWHNKLLEEET